MHVYNLYRFFIRGRKRFLFVSCSVRCIPCTCLKSYQRERTFMLIFILIPFVIARIKGYRVWRVFRVPDLYPFLAACAVHGFFVMNAWMGNHSFVKYAAILQYFMIITLVLPVLLRRIFVPTMVGVGLTFAGTMMNKIAINANDGKMPVYPTVSKWIGFYKEGQLDGTIDDLHVLAGSSTKLFLLTDYFDFGTCVLSPGDLLIHSFASIIIYYSIKAVCKPIDSPVVEG